MKLSSSLTTTLLLLLCFFSLEVLSINRARATTSSTPSTLPTNQRVLYEWVVIEYKWDSETQKQYYLNNSLWIPENNLISGIKYYKGITYTTQPRMATGVPMTLTKVVVDPITNLPLLEAFPNLQVQDLSQGINPMLRNIQSLEIDSQGNMYILDVGQLFTNEPNNVIRGPARLYIYDLNSNQFTKNFTFPESVVAYDSFLNDLVIDEIHGYIYFSNAGQNGSLVIYNPKNDVAFAFNSPQMMIDPSVLPIIINNKNYTVLDAIDGIALSQTSETLFFSPITSTSLYSIPTVFLYNFQDYSLDYVISQIQFIGIKGFSGGMDFSNDGTLYFGSEEENALRAWKVNSRNDVNQSSYIVNQNNITSIWIDSFAWDDENERILYTSNKLPLFAAKELNFNGTDANFRIWSVDVGQKSYIAGQRAILDGLNGGGCSVSASASPSPSSCCGGAQNDDDDGVTINFYFADILRGL